MTSRKALVPLAFLLTALVSGCAGPGEDPVVPGESVTLVTDPMQGRDMATASPHLHDYWGGADRKVVLDATLPIGNLNLGPANPAIVTARPEPGDVVPQGASAVAITMAWTPSAEFGALNHLTGTRLAVRTAADHEAQEVAAIGNGETVTFVSTNGQNDLPHQVLSAWEFQWLADPITTPGGLGFVSYQGELAVHVEAIRGLEIPLYPGHPDQWLGRSEIALFEEAGMTIMDGDPRVTDYRCYGGCPPPLSPGDGVVVPIDASHIVVTLDRDTPMPTRLGLAYHTAVSRDWVLAVPLEETPTHRVYVIDVLDGGDGAYAKQSSWEFVLVVEEPVENGYVADSYKVTGTVYRDP